MITQIFKLTTALLLFSLVWRLPVLLPTATPYRMLYWDLQSYKYGDVLFGDVIFRLNLNVTSVETKREDKPDV